MAENIQLEINGEKYSYEKGTTYQRISLDFQKDCPYLIIAVRVDHKLTELDEKAEKDAAVEFVMVNDPVGNMIYRRTAVFIMYKAMCDVLDPEDAHSLVVQYSLDEGYYCELKNRKEVPQELLDKVNKRMQEIVDAKTDIIKHISDKREAIKVFEKNGLHEKTRTMYYRIDSLINYYTIEDIPDYLYGFMAPDASYIRHFQLIPYDEGFVIQLPLAQAPDEMPEFNPPRKMFESLKAATRWSEQRGVTTAADLNKAIANGDILDLMLVQEAMQEKNIAEIAGDIRDSGKRIILIAGPSSSGKTTFSHRLSIQLQVLGLRPHPIPLDSYYLDHSLTPRDENGNYDFETIKALDTKKLNEDLQGLISGREVELPVYDFVSGKRKDKGIPLKIDPDEVLVLEGIHALNDELTYSLSKDHKYKIYISALTWLNLDNHARISTSDARLIRRLCRDARTRGASAEETIGMWQSVRHGEDMNIFPFQDQCDAIFNSALIYELSVLKQYAEPLLFSVTPDKPEYGEARRLLKFLNYFLVYNGGDVPKNSILREFIGGSCFDVV